MNVQENSLERKSSLKQILEEDKKIIHEIIDCIKKDPKSEPFQNPVDTIQNSDYLRIIKNNPMDLSTIENKLDKNEYALVQDVISDFKLIWYNCRIYNYESSEIYQFSDYLEKIADQKFEKYYIYYDTIKCVNYKEQYEKNIYNEDAFNDPDYLEKNSSEVLSSEDDKQFFSYLYYKMKLKKMISSLTNEERKLLFNKINDKESNELYIYNQYIEYNKENNLFFKFHIEKMTKDNIIFLIDYIKKNYKVKIEENNY